MLQLAAIARGAGDKADEPAEGSRQTGLRTRRLAVLGCGLAMAGARASGRREDAGLDPSDEVGEARDVSAQAVPEEDDQRRRQGGNALRGDGAAQPSMMRAKRWAMVGWGTAALTEG